MAERIRVLHVDDEPDFADLTADYLDREVDRFDVVTATDPREALQRLSDEGFDCVVSDYEMPEMDGLTFLADVRAELPELPFILFTGKGSEEIASEAISAGVTDYIQKRPGTSQYEVLAHRIANAVERYRAQRSLRRREERLETLLEHSTDSITIVDANGEVTYCSPSVDRLFGYCREQLIGVDFTEFVHPDDRTHVEDGIRAATAETDSIESVEFRFRRADGSWCWVEAVVNRHLDDPLIGGTVLNWRNVTEQREYERELETTNELLAAVIDASPVAILSFDLDGRVQLWNPAAEEIYGWTAEEVVGEPLPMIPADKADEGQAIYERALRGESIANLELARETKSGEIIDISLSTAPVRDRDGAVIGNVSVSQDITDRKEHEERMEEMTDRMQLALEGANSWIWDWNLETDVTTQSAVSGILGVEEETVTRPVDGFIEQLHPDDREVFLAAKERAVSGDQNYHAEYRLIADGEVRWIESRGQVYGRGSDDPTRLIGIATDVSEQKKRALERQWMMRALDQSSEAVFVSDPETGRIEFVNDTACEHLGYDREELLAMTILDIQPDLSTAETWEEHIDRVRTSGHMLFEGRHVRHDGTTFPVEVNTGLVEIEREEYLLGIARDVTHRKERERELQRRIDRLDDFASIVSHDLRNPLSVAMGHLEMVDDDVDDAHLDSIERSLDRMAALIEDLLTLAREGDPSVTIESVSIEHVVQACWQTVRTEDATLRVETDMTVDADRSRLQQLLENLLRNAVVHGGDDVTVTVGVTEERNGFYVEDDGRGIPAAAREDVFETGYTTHDSGTGFGLAIVEKIAEAHGWSVRVTGGAGGGARFEILGVRITE